MSEYGIRHNKRCCPEYQCLVGSWDGQTCKECGANCLKCQWRDSYFIMRNQPELLYIAHPYIKDPINNFEKCKIITNEYLDKGYILISPIVHSHPLDQDKHRDPQRWYDLDMHILKKCDAILMCPGWKESYGCQRELNLAQILGLRIIYYEDDNNVL